MTYLTGKRVKYPAGNSARTKTGMIVSEPFRNIDVLNSDNQPIAWSTNVAILWDDGIMEGAIDIEELKILEEDEGYVVCATWPQDKNGELIIETYMQNSTLEHAIRILNDPKLNDKNPRLAKLHFIKEK